MNGRKLALILLCCALLSSCDTDQPRTGQIDADGHTAPTEATVKANQSVLKELDFTDQQDFEDANRGLIARDPDLAVRGDDENLIWKPADYRFIDSAAPGSVNPSLWRQAQLNNLHGLFQVTDGIYQVRGYDLSNMTLIEGQSGWIIVDPLTAKETAAAAMAMVRKHLPDKPVVALIFTHSHVDHFGGVLGVLSEEEATAKGVRIIAPQGFMEEATSENIIAGTAMSRRAMFMYGKQLARSERGHVDSGLGKSPAFGRFGLLAPTEIVNQTPQSMNIDGIEFIFQNAPQTEAPAELTFYLPHAKAFNGAEVTSRQMHNLYTLRGAKVRDAQNWSRSINEAIDLFGEAEIYLASHHWPMWGNERIIAFLEQQRDLYQFIHDQTVRLFNAGMTPGEIAENIELPASIRSSFSNRGYYGTLKHNARAVYQGYLGWYDGNPANLDPLPPAEAGARYVRMAGGAEALLTHAREAYGRAEYRWSAEVLSHLVFAEPGNRTAKRLLAATYDQLGYQSESGPWRDVYLTAAYELRHGTPEQGINIAAMEDILRQTPVSRFFESMATRLNGPDAEDVELSIKITFTDLDESYLLELYHSVLHHRPAPSDTAADATLNLTHGLFVQMLTGQAGLKDTLLSDELEIEGSMLDLLEFFSLLDKPEGNFPVVTP